MTDLVAWLTQILDEDAEEAGYDKYRDDAWWMHGPFDADFVLADIAAKRAIIDEYVARDNDVDLMLGPDTERQRQWTGLRLAVRILATAYADRPGYRDEWNPLRAHP